MRFRDFFRPWTKRNNGYGFFPGISVVAQDHGLFIDKDNRILFWPDGKGPGYVMDEADVTKYMYLKLAPSGRILSVGPGYLLISAVCFIGLMIPKIQNMNFVSQLLCVLAVACLTLLLCHFCYFIFAARRKTRDFLSQTLGACETIAKERPFKNIVRKEGSRVRGGGVCSADYYSVQLFFSHKGQ